MNTIDKIILCFEADVGDKFSDAERQNAHKMWNSLDADSKAFLDGLSDEDLENVCYGEVKEGPDGEDVWWFKGAWRTLPAKVNSFLHEVWEFME